MVKSRCGLLLISPCLGLMLYFFITLVNQNNKIKGECCLIKVTRLNKTTLAINAELIEFIEATPDTVITLTDGKKIVVIESVEEIIEKIITYRQMVNQPIENKHK